MLIEIIGSSGSGKTYYSKLLQRKKNYTRIKDRKFNRFSKIFLAPSAFVITYKLKPQLSDFKRLMRHVIYILSYKYRFKNEITIADQGPISQILKIFNYSNLKHHVILDLIFSKNKFIIPDLVIEIKASSDLILLRRTKRQKRKDLLYVKNNSKLIKEKDMLPSFIISYLLIKNYIFKSSDNDDNLFLRFFEQCINDFILES